MVKTFDIHDATPQLADLVAQVVAGSEIVIVSGEEAVARLVPAAPAKGKREFGAFRGTIWIADDFDAPLPGF